MTYRLEQAEEFIETYTQDFSESPVLMGDALLYRKALYWIQCNSDDLEQAQKAAILLRHLTYMAWR